MRNYKIEGIVLRRRNFGEADRILTVLSKTEGKITVKAPGVRRIPSRRSSHVELLNFSKFTLYAGSKTFMPIVTEAHTIEDFSEVKNNLDKIGYAYYLCELIDSFCPYNQENGTVFSLFRSALLQLGQIKEYRKLIDNFEKELLMHLGFGSESIIENLLERKLRTTRTLQLFQV